MKQSVFEPIKIRLEILKANTLFSLKESLAYSLNNWGGLASTITYMLTYLVFLSALYGRVETIGGYRYSEALLFTLMVQLNFYLIWVWSMTNLEKLGYDIKTGKLDLILSKPLPPLWYVTFQKINLFTLIVEMWPATLPLLYLLFKHLDFSVTPLGLFYGALTLFLGQIATHCFQFLFTLLTFWTGESKGLTGISYQIAFFGSDAIPLEAFPKSVIFLGITAIPFLTHTALTTSYILGRTTSPFYLILALASTTIFLFIKIKAWNFALKHYASASS